MTDTNAIRRRPDGSINVDFYIARGRLARSEKAHDFTKQATKRSGKAVAFLTILAVATLFWPINA